MVTLLIGTCIFLFVIVGLLFYIIFRLKHQPVEQQEFNVTEIIQKTTHSYFFSAEGRLLSQSVSPTENQLHLKFRIGQHISEEKKLKNIEKYFESALKFKKNISLKLLEEGENELLRRHDLIFTPVLAGDEVMGIILVFQEMISKNKEKVHQNAHKEMEEQRNYALKQVDEIEAQKNDLELAFKKSSKQHIILQKALLKNERQKEELEKALEIINNHKIELEIANKEIKESSRLKEIFLANTSHEIRTPLNAIIGFTNLLLNSELTENQKRYLDNIKASGNNLLVVINDILDFSKIESGKLTLEQIDFDFRNLIKHTITTLTAKSQEKGIELKYDISPEIPAIITGDPVRLNQILTNLIGNSLKFTNPGGWIRVIATNGKMTGDNLKILFKIEDNGIGISSEKLKYIFQSFTQGESDTTRKYGGTGLGLSIVKQLIELQDGGIEVESQLGKGTAFTFYIMLRVPSLGENNSSPIANKKNTLECNGSNCMNILLVEDNFINQQMAYDTIMNWNNKILIEIAENGKIAVEKVINGNFNLVLMDIQMPEMDGNEATIKIRELPSPKGQTPIVAMTAHALKDEKDKCLKNGMNDYLSKPFDPEELFAKILKFAPNNNTVAANELIKIPTDNKPRIEIAPEAYEYFSTENLKKIYQDNTTKIAKIIGMCHASIPTEIIEIQISFDAKEWEVLRNKAHSLKPKLGYLGMITQQENAKNIEFLSQNHDNHEPKIQDLITQIKNYWEKATPELENYLSTYAIE